MQHMRYQGNHFSDGIRMLAAPTWFSQSRGLSAFLSSGTMDGRIVGLSLKESVHILIFARQRIGGKEDASAAV